jgi:hypothetical protein
VARADELEAKITELIDRLGRDFSDLGDSLRWTMTRSLIHRAVHYATERPGIEYCALATYMAEMIGHAHKLAHGDNPAAAAHKDVVH